MLNVGPLELLVVLAVALIVVGPERLPDLARSVGRVLRQFREVQDEVRNMVSSGVDDDMRDAAAEFRKVTGEHHAGHRREGWGPTGATEPSGTRPLRLRSGRPRLALDDDEEAGGPPADRLVEDAAADPTTPAPGSDPRSPSKVSSPSTLPAGRPRQPEDQAEPETPPQP